MSSRITRSAARLAAEPPVSTSGTSASIPAAGPAPSRKRKAPVRRDRSLDEPERPTPPSPPRRAKRQRTAASAQVAGTADPRRGSRNGSAMSQPRCVSSRPSSDQDRADQGRGSSSSSRPSDESSRAPASSSASRRKSSNNRKTAQGKGDGSSGRGPARSTDGDLPVNARTTTQSPPPRRQKKRPSKHSSDLIMKESEEDYAEKERKEERDSSPPSESNDGTNHSAFDDDDDEEDPFHSSLFGSRSPMGLQSTLRALSGMMSGTSSRLRDILSNLRMRDDASLQLIALQELSDLLLVSNEDNLSGQFSPDPYVKELVALMQPTEFGDENPEIMLLACRCLANLMEALRGSVANVVYGGAVPVLCQKLLDIQFIDLAEQALSVSFESAYQPLRLLSGREMLIALCCIDSS